MCDEVQLKLKVPGIDSESTLACLARSRRFGQYCKAVEDALHKRCPFCDFDDGRNKLITASQHFRAFHCNPPEAHTRIHVLIKPIKHITEITQLTQEEWRELHTIILDVKTRLLITSCGILIRDGDARLSAGTIEHLHIHIMVPDGTGRVEPPFYKGDESERESVRRAIVFEKLRTGGSESDLNSEETALVENRLN